MNYICQALAYSGIQCSYQQPTDSALMDSYFAHLAKYGLSYGTHEEAMFRFEQFKLTDQKINEINAGNGSWVAAHNKFSTFTKEEFNRVKGKIPSAERAPIKIFEESNAAEVDWRTKGAVNPVQDQGMCGSCWAFSSIAAIEGAHFLATGNLLKLAEQQFVDCDDSCYGCQGGLEIYAFDYAEQHGLEFEKDYPYTAADGRCKADSSKGQVKVTDHSAVTPRSVSQLKAAIAQQPTCVSVDAETDFQTYSSGILNSKRCGTNLDHAVTAVGYGSEDGQEYFIVRNSWGADWGENGYIRISTDGDGGSGVCGILLDSNVPTTN
jgi:KDEL-tailed cysteine endopeptidase